MTRPYTPADLQAAIYGVSRMSNDDFCLAAVAIGLDPWSATNLAGQPASPGVEPSDPHPSRGSEGAPACYANSGDDRLCTLPRGHTGLHEAHGPLPGDTLLHAWDGVA